MGECRGGDLREPRRQSDVGCEVKQRSSQRPDRRPAANRGWRRSWDRVAQAKL